MPKPGGKPPGPPFQHSRFQIFGAIRYAKIQFSTKALDTRCSVFLRSVFLRSVFLRSVFDVRSFNVRSFDVHSILHSVPLYVQSFYVRSSTFSLRRLVALRYIAPSKVGSCQTSFLTAKFATGQTLESILGECHSTEVAFALLTLLSFNLSAP